MKPTNGEKVHVWNPFRSGRCVTRRVRLKHGSAEVRIGCGWLALTRCQVIDPKGAAITVWRTD